MATLHDSIDFVTCFSTISSLLHVTILVPSASTARLVPTVSKTIIGMKASQFRHIQRTIEMLVSNTAIAVGCALATRAPSLIDGNIANSPGGILTDFACRTPIIALARRRDRVIDKTLFPENVLMRIRSVICVNFREICVTICARIIARPRFLLESTKNDMTVG
jgi:hypothetical protein